MEHKDKTSPHRAPAKPVAQGPVALAPAPDLALLQRAIADPGKARPGDILALQRLAGNRAVTRLIQAKLTVGPVGDRYEQEADRVADQVMSMQLPSPVGREGGGEIQRQAEEEEEIQTKPLAASITPLVQRQAEEEEEVQTKSIVQRRADGGFEAGPEIEGRLTALKGSGSPLSDEVRAAMEPRFGADFSGVRIHTGGEADRLNRQLSAQAFTHGQDIYMRAGKYAPGTPGSNRLLAHELTHVVQQSAGRVYSPPGSSGSSSISAIQRKIIRIQKDIKELRREGSQLHVPVTLEVTHDNPNLTRIQVSRRTRAVFAKFNPLRGGGHPPRQEYAGTSGAGLNAVTPYYPWKRRLDQTRWQDDGPASHNVKREPGKVTVIDTPGFATLYDDMFPAGLDAEFRFVARDPRDADEKSVEYAVKFWKDRPEGGGGAVREPTHPAVGGGGSGAAAKPASRPRRLSLA